MEGIFIQIFSFIIGFSCFIMLIIGLINPSWGMFWSNTSTRGKSSLIYGSLFLLCLVTLIGASLNSPTKVTAQNQVKEASQNKEDENKKIKEENNLIDVKIETMSNDDYMEKGISIDGLDFAIAWMFIYHDDTGVKNSTVVDTMPVYVFVKNNTNKQEKIGAWEFLLIDNEKNEYPVIDNKVYTDSVYGGTKALNIPKKTWSLGSEIRINPKTSTFLPLVFEVPAGLISSSEDLLNKFSLKIEKGKVTPHDKKKYPTYYIPFKYYIAPNTK